METDFLFKIASNREAQQFLAGKPAVLRHVYDQMIPEIQARLFTVGLLETFDGIQRVRDLVADVPAGGDWNQTKKDIAAEFSPYLVDPDADKETQAKQRAAADAKAELVLRTNAFDASDATQTAALEKQKAVMPYWQWHTMGDERVRSSHAALDGKAFPADSEFWQRQKEWGCRCYKTALSQGDVDEIKDADADKPPGEQRVLEGAALRDAERGFIQVSPAQAAEINPNNVEWREHQHDLVPDVPVTVNINKNARFRSTPLNDTGLRIPLESLRGKYDAVTWSIFMETARNVELGGGRTLLDWLSGTHGA